MASEQRTLPTSDLRSAAQDYKRDAERKHKWSHGVFYGPDGVHPRPIKHESEYGDKRDPWIVRQRKMAKIVRNGEIIGGEDLYFSSFGDEYTNHAGSKMDFGPVGPLPDEGVMYSFDRRTGPTNGSQILNSVMAKAIEQYEDKETAKLVRKEYELLDSEGESLALPPLKKSKRKGDAKAKGDINTASDEDYEFV